MKILKQGDRGSLVQLVQLGLRRAGFDIAADGVFGSRTVSALRAFQSENGLAADGVAGAGTLSALTPWLTGYVTHTVRPGDTLYRIAQKHASSLEAIELANSALDPLDLRVGARVTVPLPFDVVPTDVAWSSALVGYAVRGLAARYPFITAGEFGKSVMGAPLYSLGMGDGGSTVIYSAAHHANEWITTPVVLKFAEELASAYAAGGSVAGASARDIMSAARIIIAPAIDPDGVDLVTGALTGGAYFERAARIASDFPAIPFPSGWKANIAGTDLNLQYPAGWERARAIKFAQGYDRPAPRDFVGSAPLSATESRALAALTRSLDPALVLAFHTQGEVIYWRFLDYEPEGSRALAACFGAASGYAVSDTPFVSGFAGYKDWFIQDFGRPGYTIECGRGVSPLPVSQLPDIYAACAQIMALAAVGC